MNLDDESDDDVHADDDGSDEDFNDLQALAGTPQLSAPPKQLPLPHSARKQQQPSLLANPPANPPPPPSSTSKGKSKPKSDPVKTATQSISQCEQQTVK